MSYIPTQNVIDNLYSVHSARGMELSNGDHATSAGDNIIKNSQFLQVKWPFIIDLPPGNLQFSNSTFASDGSDPIFGWGAYQEALLSTQFVDCTFTGFPLPDWW